MTEQKTDQLRLRRTNFGIWIIIITLSLAALLSYFVLDERVFSWLCQHRSNWYKNNWVQVFTLLGKGWVLIWLLFCWMWLRTVLLGLKPNGSSATSQREHRRSMIDIHCGRARGSVVGAHNFSRAADCPSPARSRASSASQKKRTPGAGASNPC